MTAVLSATKAPIMTNPHHQGDALIQLSAHGSTLTVAGEIDASNAAAFRQAIDELPDGDRTVDTEAVTFIDCAGLSALVSTAVASRRDGARLVLRHPGRAVQRMIELTETTDLFTIAS